MGVRAPQPLSGAVRPGVGEDQDKVNAERGYGVGAIKQRLQDAPFVPGCAARARSEQRERDERQRTRGPEATAVPEGDRRCRFERIRKPVRWFGSVSAGMYRDDPRTTVGLRQHDRTFRIRRSALTPLGARDRVADAVVVTEVLPDVAGIAVDGGARRQQPPVTHQRREVTANDEDMSFRCGHAPSVAPPPMQAPQQRSTQRA